MREAAAVILHPGQTVVTDKPDDAAIGRYSVNGTFVAIAPDFVVTARHTSPVSNSLRIGNSFYNWFEIYDHPTADLRLLKIRKTDGTPANLTSYTRLYDPGADGTLTHPDEIGNEIVIGGQGRGVASTISNGYVWEASGENSTQRWGANRIDSTTAALAVGSTVSDVLLADFDPLGQFGWVTGEAGIATYDSGGGWFIKVDNIWTVAGMNAYTEHLGQTWFRDPAQGGVESGDWLAAIRLSSYSQFIYSASPGLFLLGDMDGDGDRDNFDIDDFELALTDGAGYLTLHPLLTNYAQRGDIDGDGDFDNFDIEPFESLLTGEAPGSPTAVPEPSTLGLAALAGAVLTAVGYFKRRRGG